MIFRGEFGTCRDCGREKVWIVVKSRYQCVYCSEKWKALRKKGIKLKLKIPKPTGELLVFKEIWKGRPHVSQISGEPIKYFRVGCFMHILGKKAYPKFRLKLKNIYLVTEDEHHIYDNVGGIEKLAETHEGWRGVLDLKQELKSEYFSASS